MLSAANRFVRRLFTTTRSTDKNRRRQTSLLLNDVSVQSLEDRCLLSAGQLDTTFGDGGIVVSNVEEFEARFHGADMAVQPDGRIVVVGTADSTTNSDRFEVDPILGGDSANRDIVVMKWLPDGADSNGDPLDHSFGTKGIVRINVGPGYEAAGAVSLLPDGKMLVAGTSHRSLNSDYDYLTHVWRLNSDGSIDQSFANGAGVATISENLAFVTDMVVEPSGRIIVVGTGDSGSSGKDFRLWAINNDGTTDVSYGTNGLVNTDFVSNGYSRYDTPARALLQNDGKLFVVGPSISSSDGVVAARYHSDGSLDTSFGVDGRFVHTGWEMFDAVILNDGRYLLGGESTGLMMLLADGTFDTSFGINGRVSVPNDAEYTRLRYSSIHRLRVLADGRIQAVTSFRNDYLQNWTAPSEDYSSWTDRSFVQFNADGSLDTSFHDNGWMIPQHSGSQTEYGFVYGDIWQDDNKILLMSGGWQAELNRLLPDFSEDTTFHKFSRSNYPDRDVLVRLPSSDEAHGVTLLPDGKILVTGRSRGTYPTSRTTWYDYPAAGGALVQRYDASGRQDTSFDGEQPDRYLDGLQPKDGSVVFSPGVNSSRPSEGALIRDVLPLGDGSYFASTLKDDRTLMSGYVINEFGQFSSESFYTYSGIGDSKIGGAVRLDDGRIAAAGRSYRGSNNPEDGVVVIVKLEAGDTPVLSEDLRWFTGTHYPIAMQLTAEGHLVLASTNAIIKYDLAGNELTTFDTPLPGFEIEIRDTILQSDERLLVTGVVDIGGVSHGFVSRFHTNGVLDQSFGQSGSVVLPAAEAAEANAITVRTGGQIVVWGNIGNSLAAFQLNADGTSDSSFGNHGLTQIVAADNAWRHVGTELAIQPDGAIVGVGYVTQFDGREDVVVVRLQGDNPVATPAVTHVSPDTGRHDRDAVTSSGNLAIYGIAVGHSTVTIYHGATAIGTTTASADGSWEFDATTISLAEGDHHFTASASLRSQVSLLSQPFRVTVDQTAPQPSVPRLSESGAWYPYDDNVTTDTRNFSGQAEGEATVSLFMDGEAMLRYYQGPPLTAIANGLPDSEQRWEIGTFSETEHLRFSEPGPHEFTTIVEDLAGNLSPLSDPTKVWFVREGTLEGRPEITVSGAGTYSEDAAAELLFSTTESGLIATVFTTVSGPVTSQPDFQGLSSVNLEGALQLSVPFLVDDDLYEPDETFDFSQTNSSSQNAVGLTPNAFTITILNDDLPTISDVPDLITLVDQRINGLLVAVGNFAEGVEVPISLSSDNAGLFPDGSLTITGTGGERRLFFNPAAGQTGSATITLVAGHGTTIVARTFTVTVASNAAGLHQLAMVPDQTVKEDESLTVDLQISAPVPSDIVVSAKSLNETLLPSSGIQVTGTGSVRQLTLSPAPNAFGETTIVVEAVNSAGQAVQKLFQLTVSSVNDPLTLQTTTAALSTLEDTELDMATLVDPLFQVSDFDSEIVSGVFYAHGGRITRTNYISGSLNSHPDGDRITFNGSPEKVNDFFETVKITPLPDFDQQITLSLDVNDSGSDTYGHVTEVIDATYSGLSGYILGLPSFSSWVRGWQIPSSVSGLQSITVGFADPVYSTGAVIYEMLTGGFVHSVEAMDEAGGFFEVWNGTDPLTAAGELSLAWPATDFPVHGLRITVDAGTNNDDAIGIDAVRLLGSHPDGPTELSASKIIQVITQEDVPKLQLTSNLLAYSGENTSNWIAINDAETAWADMTVNFVSHDPQLLPTSGIAWDYSGSSQQLIFSAPAMALGTASITISVTDEAGNTVSQTATVTVAPRTSYPSVSSSGTFTVEEDTPITFTLTLSDQNTPNPSDLLVVASSSRPWVVNSGDITVSMVGGVRTVTVNPQLNASGYTDLTFTVTSPFGISRTHTRRVWFTDVNDAPSFSGIDPRHTPVNTDLLLGTPPAGPMIVTDPDSTLAQFTLSAEHGSLQITDTSHALVTVDGSTTGGPWTFIANHQTANDILADTVFQPQTDYSGPDQITITASDRTFDPLLAGQWASLVYRTQGSSTTYRSRLVGSPGSSDWAQINDEPTILDVRFSSAVNAEGLIIYADDADDAARLKDVVTSVELLDSSRQVLTTLTGASLTTMPVSGSQVLIPWSVPSASIGSVRLTLISPTVSEYVSLDAFRLSNSITFDTLGSATSTTVIPITVSTPPTLAPLSDVTLIEDINSAPIALNISDAETLDPPVIVTAANPDLFADFVVSGSGATRQVVLVPAADEFGSTVVTVVVDDGAHAVQQTFTATIQPVNDAPEAIELSNSIVSEAADNGTSSVNIAQLLPIDVDSAGHTFGLVNGAGDTDNVLFEVQGDRLYVRSGVVLDYEVISEYAIRVEVTDSEGLTAQSSLVISVEDADEQVSLSVDGPIVEGDTGQLTIHRNTAISEPLFVQLSVSHPQEFVFPASVTIPAGQAQTVVDISTVEDFFYQQDFVALFSATVNNAPQVWLSVTVLEDDVVSPSVGRVSNLDGVNGFSLTGSQDDRAGWSVDSAGDINGDGFDDVIVAAPKAVQGASSGMVYVVFGKSGGFLASTDLATLDGTNGFQIGGLPSGVFLSWSVSDGGDINGDGIDDLIFGTHATAGLTGTTFVVFGSASAFLTTFDLSTLDGTNGYRISGIAAYDLAGYSVASAGDINSDGYDDLIIGAPRAVSDEDVIDSGAAYIVFGTADPSASVINLADLNGTNGFRIDGISQTDWTGVSVDGAGDFNGDGYADLIIGDSHISFGRKDDRPGNAYLVYGSSSGFPTALHLGTLNGTNGLRIVNDEVRSQFGRFVGGLGDVNGDGYSDVIVSAHVSNSGPAGINAGQSFVIFGTSAALPPTLNVATLNGTNGFRIDGMEAGDNTGYSGRGAGDVNADGFDDIIIGAPFAENLSTGGSPNEGEAYTVFGRAEWHSAVMNLSEVNGTNGFAVNGAKALDRLGVSVSGNGDVNGDGFDDIIVGAPWSDPNDVVKSSNAYVIFGHVFSANAAMQVGDEQDNIITAVHGGNTDILVGGQGNDVLSSDGGADVLRGGAGDDILVIPDANFTSTRRLSGGTGVDTLRLDGREITLDLTTIADNRIESIEAIDLTGSGPNALRLDVVEVLNLSGQSNTLTVFRNEDDLVHRGTEWTQQLDETDGLLTFEVYTHGAAILKVQKTTNVTLSSVASSITEGTTQTQEFTFTRDNTLGPLTIDVAVAGRAIFGSDYTEEGATEFNDQVARLAFVNGQAVATITIRSLEDNIVEGTENVTLWLPGSGPQSSASATITDNDSAVFTINDVSAGEEKGTIEFSVALSHPIDIDVILDVSSLAGTATANDFGDSTHQVMFAAGTTATQIVDFSITDDGLVENTEHFSVGMTVNSATDIGTRLVNVSDSATATIIDNDAATFTIEDATANEADGAVTFTVNLSQPIDIDLSLNVDFATDTTIAADFNSASQTVLFAAGNTTSQKITVDLQDDNIVELTESFLTSLAIDASSSIGNRAVDVSDSAIGTIADNDTATFSIEDVTTTEDSGEAVFAVSISNPVDIDVTVDFIPAAGSATFADFNLPTDSVTFSAGTTDTQSISVVIADDNLVELTEQFSAALGINSAVVLGSRSVDVADTASATIADNDTASFTIEGITVNEAAGTATLSVSLSDPLDTEVMADVIFAAETASSSDFTNTTKTVTFASGSNTAQTVAVVISDDNLVELTEAFTASLSVNPATPTGTRPVDVTSEAKVYITDNDSAVFTIDDVTAVEDETAQYRVSVSNPLDVDVTLELTHTPGTATAEDFASQAKLITFPAGTSASQILTVAVTDDDIVELTEQFSSSLSISATTPLGNRNVDLSDTAEATITDNDTALFTVEDVAVDESGDAAVFSVQLSNPLDVEVVLDVAYFSGTADDSDVDMTTDWLVFPAGTTTAQLTTASIMDDSTVELAESFSARLVLNSDTNIGSRSIDISDTAIGTITDNDTAAFTIEDAVVSESNGAVTFQITQSNPIDIDVTIDVDFLADTAGLSDFDGATQTLVFPAGQTALQSISVPVVGDEIVELSESFTASMAINAATLPGSRKFDTSNTATATITDDDSAVFLIEDVTVDEGDGTATFVVSVSNPISTDVTLDITFAPDTGTQADFESATQTVTFEAGETEAQQVTIAIHDDETVELTETFTAALQLNSATLLESRTIVFSDTATGTIIDNDTAFLTIDDITVNESDGEATFRVSVSNPLDMDLIVDVAYSPDTAIIDDWDEDNTSLTFAAGTTEPQSVSIAITDDNIVEATESFVASLKVNTAVQVGTRNIDVSDSAIGLITDNDTAVFTVEDVEVNESDGSATLIISLSNPLDVDTRLNLGFTPETASSSDFEPQSQSVTFLANTVDSQTVTVSVLDDNLVEQAESFFVSLALDTPTSIEQRLVDVTDFGTVFIQDNDTATFTIDDITVTESDAAAVFTVSLSNPLDIEVIAHAVFTNGIAGESDFQSSVATFTIPAGSTAGQTVSAVITDDNIAEAREDFSVALTLDSAVALGSRSIDMTDQGLATIADNDTAVFVIDSVTADEASGLVVFTVTPSSPVDTDVVIDVVYASDTASDSDFDSATDTVTFPAGTTTPQTLSVAVTDDNIVEATEAFTASLAINTATATTTQAIDLSDTATGTITDNDTAVFTIEDVVVNESDGEAQLAVSLSTALDIDVVINIDYSFNTATTEDIDHTTSTVSFAAGETSAQTVIVPIHDDDVAEEVETFTASLAIDASTPTHDRLIDVNATSTITIQDDDPATMTGDVDGDLDFDANDTFLMHLVKLSGTNAQIDQSKGNSQFSAAEIRSLIDGMGIVTDVDGDHDFDANDSFLVHLVKLAGTNAQIDQAKGSSPLSADQIRENVNLLGNSSQTGESSRNFNTTRPERAITDANPKADLDLSELNYADFDQPKHAHVLADDSTPQQDAAQLWTEFRTWIDLL